MNELARVAAMTLSIAAVERDTGLSKDTLRVWERRYGFPSPGRDGIGERAYTFDQVEKLRVIKRLMDAGHRPGRIVPLAFAELQLLSLSTVDQTTRKLPVALGSGDLAIYISLLRRHQIAELRTELGRSLSRHGVARFVTEVVGPLGMAVGDNRLAARAMGPVGRLDQLRDPLPPILIRHGDADPLVADLQSQRLMQAWTAADPAATIDYALVPGAGHGGAPFETGPVLADTLTFLRKVLL